jgi:hypothetical protein
MYGFSGMKHGDPLNDDLFPLLPKAKFDAGMDKIISALMILYKGSGEKHKCRIIYSGILSYSDVYEDLSSSSLL